MPAVQVLCAGAAKSAFLRSAAALREQTGIEVNAKFAAVGTLVKMLGAGEPADMVVLSGPAAEQLLQSGELRAPAVPLGTVGVALALKEGSAPLDVSTADKLRAVLLGARSIAYGDPAHGDSSGIHFHRVLRELGLGQQLSDKVRLAASGLAVAEAVRSGEVDLGATQSSVIRACEGVLLAAMLPGPLQQWTTYTAALTVHPGMRAVHEGAQQLLDWMGSERSRAVFAAAGFANVGAG